MRTKYGLIGKIVSLLSTPKMQKKQFASVCLLKFKQVIKNNTINLEI